jgi:predicted esterase
MTLGTKSVSGQHILNDLGDFVYVPTSAAGTRRVPLVLSFSGDDVARWRPLADHYGMIYVALHESMQNVLDGDELREIDSALQTVLSTYAVDPDKIALLGMSNGGLLTTFVGCQNLDIFSRIGLISPIPGQYPKCDDPTRPQAQRTQFFLTLGTGEPDGVIADVLDMIPPIRRDGHPLQTAVNLRFHQSRRKDYGPLWQWLAETWGVSQTTRPPFIPVRSLTIDIVARMTEFWTRVRTKHPRTDSDAETWPQVDEKAVTISVANERMAVYDFTDVHALAAKDVTITDALKAAKLTIQKEEEYRSALIGAYTSMRAQGARPALIMDSHVQHNVDFLKAHRKETDALMDLIGVSRCEAGIQETSAPGSCVGR